MIIGYRIRQLREQKGITHDEIQEFCGLDHSYLARIEQGRTVPRLETLERIAAALAVPLYWLFFAVEEDSGAAPPAVDPPARQQPDLAQFTGGKVQLLSRLKQACAAQFEADPAFLLEFARRMALGKPES
jgi:transcriptional regulator with XRE-family HTH domain